MRRRVVVELAPCGECGRSDCPAVDAEHCAALAVVRDQRRRFEGRTLDGTAVTDRVREIDAQRAARRAANTP